MPIAPESGEHARRPACRGRASGRAAAPIVAALLALALGLAGCGAGGSKTGATPAAARAAADSAAIRERSQALIENGNLAFRAGDYKLASRRYASAAVVDPNDPAAYYGLGMALSKLGRDEQARVAYARARDLMRQGRVVSDSLDR